MNCCQLMGEDGNRIQTLKTNMENAWRMEALHTDSQCVVTLILHHQGFTPSRPKPKSECFMEYSHHRLVLKKVNMFYVLKWVYIVYIVFP